MKEIFLSFAGFPSKNSTLAFDCPLPQFGGAVINIAWYAARLGLKSVPVCTCGLSDRKDLMIVLRKMDLPVNGVFAHQLTSDILLSFLDNDHNHYSFYLRGKLTRPVNLASILGPAFPKYTVFSGGRHIYFRKLFQKLPRAYPNSRYAFNPSYAVYLYSPRQLRSIIDAVNIVFLNQPEASFVLDALRVPSVESICSKDSQTVIIAMGHKGVSAIHNHSRLHVRSYAKRVANPIGGGDSLLAGILYSLGRGANVKEALEFGSAMAALIVESEDVRVPVTLNLVEERLVQGGNK